MEYGVLVRDFANRTYQNLKVIEDLSAHGETVFETTQLINSMLGLVVLPKEKDLFRNTNNQHKTIRQLVAEG